MERTAVCTIIVQIFTEGDGHPMHNRKLVRLVALFVITLGLLAPMSVFAMGDGEPAAAAGQVVYFQDDEEATAQESSDGVGAALGLIAFVIAVIILTRKSRKSRASRKSSKSSKMSSS